MASCLILSNKDRRPLRSYSRTALKSGRTYVFTWIEPKDHKILVFLACDDHSHSHSLISFQRMTFRQVVQAGAWVHTPAHISLDNNVRSTSSASKWSKPHIMQSIYFWTALMQFIIKRRRKWTKKQDKASRVCELIHLHGIPNYGSQKLRNNITLVFGSCRFRQTTRKKIFLISIHYIKLLKRSHRQSSISCLYNFIKPTGLLSWVKAPVPNKWMHWRKLLTVQHNDPQVPWPSRVQKIVPAK